MSAIRSLWLQGPVEQPVFDVARQVTLIHWREVWRLCFRILLTYSNSGVIPFAAGKAISLCILSWPGGRFSLSMPAVLTS